MLSLSSRLASGLRSSRAMASPALPSIADLGQRAGEQPRSSALVVGEQHRSRVRGQQPGDGQDQGQGGQAQALPS